MSTFVTSPYVGCSAAEKPFWPKRDKSQGFGDSVPESGKPPFPYFVLRAGPASRTGFCSSHPLVRTTHTKQRRTPNGGEWALHVADMKAALQQLADRWNI